MFAYFLFPPRLCAILRTVEKKKKRRTGVRIETKIQLREKNSTLERGQRSPMNRDLQSQRADRDSYPAPEGSILRLSCGKRFINYRVPLFTGFRVEESSHSCRLRWKMTGSYGFMARRGQRYFLGRDRSACLRDSSWNCLDFLGISKKWTRFYILFLRIVRWNGVPM